ncbi:hypothetical protein WP50_16195, partial [Lactiplantibacillus plantarum]
AIETARTSSQANVILGTSQKTTALTAKADATCDLLTGKVSVSYITLSFQAIVLTLMLLAVH